MPRVETRKKKIKFDIIKRTRTKNKNNNKKQHQNTIRANPGKLAESMTRYMKLRQI
jgi:hypothetical protein